jgi:hypothetical protein
VAVGQQEALSAMRDIVALWYVGHGTAAQVVYAACDLLAEGFDGPSLCMLAAVSIDQADTDVPDLLEPALHDVGLTYHPKDSLAAQQAGLIAMAAQTLSNRLPPRALAAWAHSAFGHAKLELAEHLAALDDTYDTLEFTNTAPEDIDAEVMAEARRIVSS